MITHECRQSYPSDLKDKEWEVLEPHLPPPSKRGRPLEYSLREILNAILYILRIGTYHRLSKEYEILPETSEAMIYAAMIHNLRRSRATPPGHRVRPE